MLFAVAAVFGAAKGQLVVSDLHGVDPRVARLELVDRPLSSGHIAGKNARPQAKFGSIGFLQCFVEIFDAHDWQKWTKRFFGPHTRALGHIHDHGWLEKVTFVELAAFRALAAGDNSAAALDSVGQ